MPKPAGLLVGFVALSALFGALEALWPAKRQQRRLRAGLSTDLAYWLFTPVVSKMAARLAVIAGVVTLALASGARLNKESLDWFVFHRSTTISALPGGAQALLALVFGDFLGYWSHRLFHGRRLWPYHAVHHGSTELDWLSSVRLHPINDATSKVIQALPLIWLGIRPGVLAAYVPFLTLYAIGLHANLTWDFGPLRAVLASPRFHRWHHTSEEEGLDKNFAGLLPVWDILFGTYYMPADRLPERFGVKGEAVPEGLFAQLAYPFLRLPN